jgi:hypothetical protein
MPKIPILMPQLGESIAEATVVRIPFAEGDEVDGDVEVLEVETNKATMGVTTPCRGKVIEWSVELNKSYPVGTYSRLARSHGRRRETSGIGRTQSRAAPSSRRPGSDDRRFGE